MKLKEIKEMLRKDGINGKLISVMTEKELKMIETFQDYDDYNDYMFDIAEKYGF